MTCMDTDTVLSSIETGTIIDIQCCRYGMVNIVGVSPKITTPAGQTIATVSENYRRSHVAAATSVAGSADNGKIISCTVSSVNGAIIIMTNTTTSYGIYFSFTYSII